MVKITADNKIMLIDLIYANYPYLPYSAICKTLRNKDVKVNGKRVSSDIELVAGDEIILYLDVAAYEKKPYSVIFENDYVLIVSKDQGVTVNNDKNSLIDAVNKDYTSLKVTTALPNSPPLAVILVAMLFCKAFTSTPRAFLSSTIFCAS